MPTCARQEERGQTFRSTLEDQTTQSLAVRSPVRETTQMRGASMQAENVTVECKECRRTFRMTSDRKRHKCLAERAKPVRLCSVASAQSGPIGLTCRLDLHV